MRWPTTARKTRHLRALRDASRRVNPDRDKLDNDDTVTVTLEPFLDYLRGYSFAVNGYGVQSDSMIVVQNAQSTASGNLSYNALYYSGGQLTEDGWTAEIAIPIRSLRYPAKKAGEAHRWGPSPTCGQRQRRVRRLVAHLPQRSEFPGSDRHADRDDELFDAAQLNCCRRLPRARKADWTRRRASTPSTGARRGRGG